MRKELKAVIGASPEPAEKGEFSAENEQAAAAAVSGTDAGGAVRNNEADPASLEAGAAENGSKESALDSVLPGQSLRRV